MYQENSQIDQITVIQDGTVFIRHCNLVLKDGIEISKSYLRRTLVPGVDVSEFPENVQSICASAWTPEVIAAYQSKIAQVA